MAIRAGDIGAIEDTGGLVPEGRHVVTVAQGKEQVADDGSEVWVLTLRTETGQQLLDFIRWTPNLMIRGKLACKALGVDLAADPEAALGAKDLEERRCEVDVEHRPRKGDGRIFANVSFRGYHSISADTQAAQAAQATQTAQPAAEQEQPAEAAAKRLF